MDARVSFKICLDIVGSSRPCDAELARKAEIADAIDDAEVDGFRMRTLLRRDVLERDAHDFSGCSSVDVFLIEESTDEPFIFRHMREHAELDLRVIGGNEGIVTLSRNEERSDLLSFFRPDRNILQVRIGA